VRLSLRWLLFSVWVVMSYILVDKFDVSLNLWYCLLEYTEYPTALAIPCTSLSSLRVTKTQCDCVPLLHAATGVSQVRSIGWSIPCASSYLMNRDLQIASHFTWGWAFVLYVPTLLVTYHHTHSGPSNFTVLMLLGMRVGSCDRSATSRIAEFSWNIYTFQMHICSECTHYI